MDFNQDYPRAYSALCAIGAGAFLMLECGYWMPWRGSWLRVGCPDLRLIKIQNKAAVLAGDARHLALSHFSVARS